MNRDQYPDRIEEQRRPDGSLERRTYLDGKLVDRRIVAPAGIAPQHHPRNERPPERAAR